MKTIIALASFAALTGVSARNFTVKNNCAYTVWPAIFTDPNTGSAKPTQPTGWEAAPGTTISFSVPDTWKAGRIWGRTSCDFTKGSGPSSCVTGGCNGGLLCDQTTGTGAVPATIAEWTLGANGADYSDVSVVDGFNIPISVTNNKGCATTSCSLDLNAKCPSQLADVVNGKVVGCKSACTANLDGTPADSANCCTGSHGTAATCPASKVLFYTFFKSACPTSITFPYDELNAPLTCSSSLKADYTLTFCP